MIGARHDRNLSALICLVLAIGTIALYWPATHHPFILYDDKQYVTDNPHVTGGLSRANFAWAFSIGEAANWHPLTWLSHQLDCQLFGVDAGRHHLINVLFHATNSLLLFILLRVATGAVWRSGIVAALFAWHPLHVESVAWVAERKDVLSAFFWLLSLLAYVRYVQTRPQRLKSRVAYAAALLCFAAGLMSKPMVVTLPFVLLLLDFWPLGRLLVSEARISNVKSLLLEKVPFFLLAVAGSVVTYLAQAGAGAVWSVAWPDRLANALVSYVRYLSKLFYPSNLSIIYPYPDHWPILSVLGAVIILAALTAVAWRGRRKSPFVIVGWLWFLGTMVPTIGVIQVGGQSMADRYTYLPSIGFFIMLVWSGAEFLASRPLWKKSAVALTAGVLAGCLLVASIQLSFWRDNVSLFLHALAAAPGNYIAANALGNAFEEQGDKVHALVMYREAVRLQSHFPQSQYNYGRLLMDFGDTQEAFAHLEIAAVLERHDADIQYSLGDYFAVHGNWTNALTCYSNALVARPDFPAVSKEVDHLRALHPPSR